MMSLSMYRPTKVFPSKVGEHDNRRSKPKGNTKSAVRRSSSLSRDPREIIVEGTTNINEERGPSSFQRDDSIHSDGDDFFLPMDEMTDCSDGDRDETYILRCAQRTSIATDLADQEEKRHAAISKLEHFFLGESCVTTSKTKEHFSPLAVMDLSFTSSPKRNMFGDMIEDITPWPHQQTPQSKIESIRKETPTFSKLKSSDRAHSLPLVLHTMTDSSSSGAGSPHLKSITKKPSLKKISSIGTDMAKRVASEGSLLRTVSFSNLSIREYPPAISDNPSCSFGPPVQLDWDYEAEQTHPIDLYEQCRQPRRASHDLLLSYYDRRFLLIKQAGYSKKEVTDAIKAAERVKRERMLTDLFLPAQALDETVENFFDYVKRFFSIGDSQPMERSA